MARMLGTVRQAWCGKCCGYHNKKTATIFKRAQRSAEKQQLRKELQNAW